MPKFKLICDHSNSWVDEHVVTHEFKVETLPDVLEHIEYFLRGSGYQVNGTLDVIPDDEYYGKPDQEMFDDTDVMSNHSDYYKDKDRNR